MNLNEVGENHGNVVQAHHVGSIHLVSPAPPVTALNGLREASKSFTGREPELANISAATGLTVVSGLAGVGKTELVLRYAESEDFPGGRLFVDLQGYDDDRRVTSAQALKDFLAALGVQKFPESEAACAALFHTLTACREPMLIVIDNARSAQDVRPLLPNNHRTIVTSRHKLVGLDDAHHLTLGMLPSDEATALVGDAELAELCGRLPLALRIMAALRCTEPGHDWVTELREAKLDLLDDGDERSVRAAFELSYRALTEEQRRFFRLAALHPSHEVTVEGSAQLAERTEAQARKLLRELRTAHLLEPGDRFHDLVRQFATACVRGEERQEIRDQAVERLYLHFGDRLEHMHPLLDTPDEDEAIRWFDQHAQPLWTAMGDARFYRARAAHTMLMFFDMSNASLVAKDRKRLADEGYDVQPVLEELTAKLASVHALLEAGQSERATEELRVLWPVVSHCGDLTLFRSAMKAVMIASDQNMSRLAETLKDDPR